MSEAPQPDVGLLTIMSFYILKFSRFLCELAVMDPLSIAASVIAILTAAGQVKKGLERLRSLKSAPQGLCALTNEVSEYLSMDGPYSCQLR